MRGPPISRPWPSSGQNQPSSAVTLASRYVTLTPNDPDGVKLLARAHLANRRPDLALGILVEAASKGLDDAPSLDLLGTAHAALGDTSSAIAAFGRALAQSPGNPTIEAHLARVLVDQGQPGTAVANLNANPARAAQPDRLEALATALIAAGDLDRAAQTIERLKQQGDTEQVGILTGMLALARFDPEQAVAAFAATATRFPSSTIARLDLAKAQILAGRQEAARAIWTDLLAKDPGNLLALENLVQFDVGDGNYAEAIKALERARTALPRNGSVLAMLSDVLIRTGDPARALAAIPASRVSKDASPVLISARARALVAAKRPEEAETLYRDALATAPDRLAALQLATLQQDRRDLVAAKATLDTAIRTTPNDFDLLTRRVELEAAIAGPEAAARIAATFAADDAQRPVAAVLVGDAMIRAGLPADAAAAFRTEWTKTPTDALALRLAEAQMLAGDDQAAMARLQAMGQDPSAAVLRAQIAIRAGQWPAAGRELELALRGRPNDPALLNNLAWAYHTSGDNRARAVAQRAYLASPTPDAADTLGWITLAQEPEAALALLLQAAKQRPDDLAIRYHLAAALDRTGKPGEARPLLQAALADGKPFEGRADAAALLAGLRP